MGPSGIFFDLYGTLVILHENRRAWDAWHEELLKFVRTEKGVAAAQKAASCLAGFWEGAEGGGNSNETVFEYKIARFLEGLDIHPPKTRVGELANNLCKVWQDQLRVDPDAVPVLSALQPEVPLGLVTNFDHPPHVHRIMRDFNFSTFFRVVVISAEEMIKKPDPRILVLACERAQCIPEKSYYVGDSIVDYKAAKGASMTPILIRRVGQSEVEGNYTGSNNYVESDKLLADLVHRGDLLQIENLREILDLKLPLL